MQVLSRREQYRLGMSAKALGPWKKKVVSPSLLKMQTRISTPTITVPKLVSRKFEPNIIFPVGPDTEAASPTPDLEASLPEASWVNFLEAIGLQPDNTKFYDMQSEPDLVNGIVPMRWKGRDLVAISSMLGFQSYEKRPSYKQPMPLPMQWSGPLGWLQFRASSDGCIVEFRRGRELKDQLSTNSHEYYGNLNVKLETPSLEERLWQSIGGLYLDNGELLFLGGADSKEDKKPGKANERSIDEIIGEIRGLEEDPTNEDIKRIVWGNKKNRPEAVKKGSSPMSESQSVSDLLSAMSNERNGAGDCEESTVDVMDPCPGLLSVVIEGELMYSRGLDHSTCHEFHRTATDYDEVKKSTHPYHLGNLYMNEDLLKLMKQAVLRLRPDSFYLTSTGMFISDVNDIWKHVRDLSNNSQYEFPATKRPKQTQSDNEVSNTKLVLHHAMILCEEFQRIRVTGRAHFTINDMRILSAASASLRVLISPKNSSGKDLIWAMIMSPRLFADLARRFGGVEVERVLGLTVESKDGCLDCTKLKDHNPDFNGKYSVPLLDNGEFTGTQVLAAFLDVFLTFFWIDKCWGSAVALYDSTMPQTVTMC